MLILGTIAGSFPFNGSIYPVSGNTYPTTPEWNPADAINITSVTNGGKDLVLGTAASNTGIRTFAIPRNGKVYFEVEILSVAASDGTPHFGIRRMDEVENVGAEATVTGTHYHNHPNGIKDGPDVVTTSAGQNAVNTTWQIAIDWNSGEWWMGRDNTWAMNNGDVGNPSTGAFSLDDIMPLGDFEWGCHVEIHSAWGGNSMRLVTAVGDFVHTPPTNFVAWEDAITSSYETEVASDSPIGYWKMNETAGTTLVDGAGSIDLTLVDTYTLGESPVITAGRSVNFNDAVASASSTGSLQITGDLTMEAWVKSDFLNGNRFIIANLGAGESEADNYLYSFGINAFGQIYIRHEYSAGTNEEVIGVTQLKIDTDYHIVVTRDVSAPEYIVWINGIKNETFAYTNNPTGGTNNEMHIGRADDNNLEYFEGDIDQVAIYDDILSDARILAHYAAGVPIGFAKAGVDNGAIPNASLTADTTFGGTLVASNGRLNGIYAWSASSSDPTASWWKVDLGSIKTINAVHSQGSNQVQTEWITGFEIDYNDDNGGSWTSYNSNEVLTANSDYDSVVINALTPFTARYVRVRPKTVNSWVSGRFEFIVESI